MRPVDQPQSRRRLGHFAACCIAAGCLLLLGDFNASAQDALGRGDALDANPGVGTGGRNLAIPTPDYRSRNLVITGDVAGGRGFRGSVGYFADQDFRGSLGSDDLFSFRAGSALSSPRFAGLGRVADQFRFGQDLAILEYRRSPDISRRQFRPDGMPATDRRVTSVPGDDQVVAERVSDRYFAFDEAESDRLRALQEHSQESRPVGLTMTEDGDRLLISASPLRGITLQDERLEQAMRGITPFDMARLRDDARRGRIDQPVGMARVSSFSEQLRIEEPTRSDREDMRLEGLREEATDSPHVEILQRIAQRYASVDDVQLSLDAALLEQLDDEFAELRESLRTMRLGRDRETEAATPSEDQFMPWPDEDAVPLVEDEDRAEPRLPDRDQREDAADRDPLDSLLPGERIAPRDRLDRRHPDEDEEAEPRRRRPMAATDEMMDLLRHGHTIDRLAPSDGTRLNELILSGQSSLRRGDYLTAESRFMRALRLEPNHPMASIGVAHAQLGAGLYPAAANTLRRALSDHPELIDARYDVRLLPQEPRLQQIIEELEAELDDDRLGSASRLLLAYIGHHRRDRALIERGLKAMEADDADDPLLPVLRGVWLAEPDDEPEK